MGIRSMLRRYLFIDGAMQGEPQRKPQYSGPQMIENMFSGLPLGIIVAPISNGYILRIEHNDPVGRLGNRGNRPEVIYAADENDVAMQIVAFNARMKMGIGDTTTTTTTTTMTKEQIMATAVLRQGGGLASNTSAAPTLNNVTGTSGDKEGSYVGIAYGPAYGDTGASR